MRKKWKIKLISNFYHSVQTLLKKAFLFRPRLISVAPENLNFLDPIYLFLEVDNINFKAEASNEKQFRISTSNA